jgi:tRNA(adenine34) deaminase
MNEHEHYMHLALKEAEKAYQSDEVPVGAVVVLKGQVIGKGYNQTEMLHDPTAHAEMIAITAAANHEGSNRLLDASLYVTMEPCPMCAGAIVWARIRNLIFGTYDPKAGACSTLYNIVQDPRLNHHVFLTPGILEDQCSKMVSNFFEKLRQKELIDQASRN